MLTKSRKRRPAAKRRLTQLATDANRSMGGATDGGTDASHGVRAALALLLADSATPAAARVNAARTLAELDGMIGRHALPPPASASAPVSTLTRTELIAELEHLRTLISIGLVR